MIIQSGIVEVVFVSDKYSHDEHVRASKRMLTMAGVSMHACMMVHLLLLLLPLYCIDSSELLDCMSEHRILLYV